MGFSVIRETEDYSQVALSGRLDAPGVEAIESDFMEHTSARRKHALVDFSEVTFIASMGIRMLIRTAQTLRLAEVKLVLIKPQPLVVNALEIAGLTSLLLIAPDAMQAEALLAND